MMNHRDHRDHRGHGRHGMMDMDMRDARFMHMHGCPHEGMHAHGGMHGEMGGFGKMFAEHFADRAKGFRGVFNLGALQEDAFDVVVEDRAEESVVHIMLPGVARKNISLENLPGMLVVRVERDGEEKATEQALLLRHCDEQAIRARHRDGVLEISVPKTKGRAIEVE